MKEKVIPAVKARIHLGEIMKRAYKNGERFVVEKSGIPMVAILNAAEYHLMVQEREERFEVLDSIASKLPEIPVSEREQDVERAIQAIRKKHA